MSCGSICWFDFIVFMQEPKQGEKPRLNLVQVKNEEEGDESQVLLDM